MGRQAGLHMHVYANTCIRVHMTCIKHNGCMQEVIWLNRGLAAAWPRGKAQNVRLETSIFGIKSPVPESPMQGLDNLRARVRLCDSKPEPFTISGLSFHDF